VTAEFEVIGTNKLDAEYVLERWLNRLHKDAVVDWEIVKAKERRD